MLSSSPARLVSSALFLTFVTACGGNEPPPKDASVADRAPKQESGGPTISATSEIGGMNEDDVDAAFKASLKSFERCLNLGAKRVEFLGGSVAFLLKIDGTGHVTSAYFEHSTLGSRPTERCMLDAVRAKSWPKPVGGEHGLARKSFDFDAPNDVRPPTTWDEHEAAPGLKKIASEIAECKRGRSGPFEATLYVGTDGKVLSASVTPPDEDGDGVIDCLVGVLEAATFPSPGSWPAKVTLAI